MQAAAICAAKTAGASAYEPAVPDASVASTAGGACAPTPREDIGVTNFTDIRMVDNAISHWILGDRSHKETKRNLGPEGKRQCDLGLPAL